MELPHEYPYNPRLRLIFLVSGVGLLWKVYKGSRADVCPRGSVFGSAFFP